jgi:hypothetical protein
MANPAPPAHPALDLDDGIITFSNEGVTIEAQVHIDVPHQSITVESATLTTPHDTTVELGITNFELPAPVAERVFDQVTPSVASVPNATLSQEGEMVDRAVPDPADFLHEFEGGAAFRLPAVQGSVEGSLGGPDTHITIDLALNPPAIGNPNERFIEQTVVQSHLNLTFELTLKIAEPEALSFSWGSTNPETDWLIV